MRRRKPRKGELNYQIQRIVTRAWRDALTDVAVAASVVRDALSNLPKKWGVRETIVEYDTELVPVTGDWKPGRMRSFVECLRVVAYRNRPNRTIAEHRVNFVWWPITPDDLTSSEKNPMVSAFVVKPQKFVFKLAKTEKGRKPGR